jgi:hypothetical protein
MQKRQATGCRYPQTLLAFRLLRTAGLTDLNRPRSFRQDGRGRTRIFSYRVAEAVGSH